MEKEEKEKKACETDRESWTCPNMKPVPGDLSLEYEKYECKYCGRRINLYYDEMS